MHTHNLQSFKHEHDFSINSESSKKKTLLVICLTVSMMIIEVAAGMLYGSMALLADGWHMGTHAGAIGIAYMAYRYEEKYRNSKWFSFGAGKIPILGGYTSAVILAIAALLMIIESVKRLIEPRDIHFNEAIIVAIIGLLVNIISAVILKDDHHHDHGDHHHEHEHHHDHEDEHDHNLRAAYLHVIADALTSMLALVALIFGRNFGWIWLDPVMGIVGGLVISRWAWGLLKSSGVILLDVTPDDELTLKIKECLESYSDVRVVDMHLWKPGSAGLAASISLVTHFPESPEQYKNILREFHMLKHVTIEVLKAPGEACVV